MSNCKICEHLVFDELWGEWKCKKRQTYIYHPEVIDDCEDYKKDKEKKGEKMDICKSFTKWYVKHGYTWICDADYISHFRCPFWVKPLLRFFSPSVYVHEFLERFYDGKTELP